MNTTEDYKPFFKEINESGQGIACPDSSSKKSNPSDSYLSNFSINKWKNTPDELKNYNQWVIWQVGSRNEKETKVPYQPNGTND